MGTDVQLPTKEGKANPWNHPFRRFKSVLPGDAFSIENSEWVEARNLSKGDKIFSADGSLLVVEFVIIDQREETVYNFEVEDFHTYFVGEDGVWVHNQSCLPPVTGTNPIKANSTGTSLISNLLLYPRAIMNGNFQKETEEINQTAKNIKEIIEHPEKINLPKRT